MDEIVCNITFNDKLVYGFLPMRTTPAKFSKWKFFEWIFREYDTISLPNMTTGRITSLPYIEPNKQNTNNIQNTSQGSYNNQGKPQVTPPFNSTITTRPVIQVYPQPKRKSAPEYASNSKPSINNLSKTQYQSVNSAVANKHIMPNHSKNSKNQTSDNDRQQGLRRQGGRKTRKPNKYTRSYRKVQFTSKNVRYVSRKVGKEKPHKARFIEFYAPNNRKTKRRSKKGNRPNLYI
jgi:hypothetical protein